MNLYQASKELHCSCLILPTYDTTLFADRLYIKIKTFLSKLL